MTDHARRVNLDSPRWTTCAIALALLAGCGPQTEPSNSTSSARPSASSRVASSSTVKTRSAPAADSPRDASQVVQAVPAGLAANSTPSAAPAHRASVTNAPEVLLSSHHAATCQVKVGDPFPRFNVQTLDGQITNLADHLGSPLTVVVFWNRLHVPAVEQVCRLDQEITRPFASKGLEAIAINVNDSIEDAQGLLQVISHEFLTLLDPTGDAFRQVASEGLPRTYLLDAQGTILWFDLEYSRSMRRDLQRAIEHYLGEESAEVADKSQSDVR